MGGGNQSKPTNYNVTYTKKEYDKVVAELKSINSSTNSNQSTSNNDSKIKK